MAGPKYSPLAERGVRQRLSLGRGRARPGQARGAVHQDERHGRTRSGGDPGRLPPDGRGNLPQAARDTKRMGQYFLELKGLASRVVRESPRRHRPERGLMTEQELTELIASVKAGRMSRRAFVHKMVGLGLTASLATQVLAHAGLAQTAPQTDYKP